MVNRLVLSSYFVLFAVFLPVMVFAQLTAPPAAATPQQDTLHLTLDSAENIFLRQNLSLLAQRYNIDAQKALVIQSKLYANPNFNIEHGLYNTETHKVFPFGSQGETSAGLSQLVMLAGKRNKQIKIARANVKLSEFEFYDLLRTLKFTLRDDFYNIYYLQQSAKAYDEEINSLQKVVDAFVEQKGKGYISQKEVVRIQAQLYSLKSEYRDLLEQIADQQSEMRLVLQVKPVYIDPLVDTSSLVALNPRQYPLPVLLDSAYSRRSDLLIARANTEISKLNYSYQKALGVPDVTFNLAYDQQGSYIKNYTAAGVAIDLPVFNRNQGNIKSAKAMIDVNTATQKSTEATVEEQVYRVVEKATAADKLYRNIDASFASDFQRLMHEVLINYQKRNISMLDFLDFYDSYKQHVLQLNSIQYNRVRAFEELNFVTGTNFFN
ncbi:TolC family protein [Chitinophaga polysaccharea]|uniref:TolC family protein n=1 Tax=Chitinophaga polysaccharea TaxID=1293035 RepID=UPI001455796A|nr:TolC family protein [Chitinophaga polysaccharea]NLR60591.1 TolC family protein [Chitinophaga polysaccharea]